MPTEEHATSGATRPHAGDNTPDLAQYMGRLTTPQRNVVEQQFGLIPGVPPTRSLAEIAKRLNMTLSQVAVLQAQATARFQSGL